MQLEARKYLFDIKQAADLIAIEGQLTQLRREVDTLLGQDAG